MAWNDVASNQMVSYLDASTSPFALNAGQSHLTTLPAANQCMDKTAMLTKYNLNAGILRTSYASDQLVPKSAWATGAAAPAWVSNGSIGAGVNGTTVSIPYPTTVLSGDLIILSLSERTNGALATVSGFTLRTNSFSINGHITSIWYKFATGTEGGTSITVTSPVATSVFGITIQYRNVSTTNPFGGGNSSTVNISSQTTFSNAAVGVSSIVPGALDVIIISIQRSSVTSSSNGTFTYRAGGSSTVGTGRTIISASQLLPTSGTSGGLFSISTSTATSGSVFEFLLNPI